jgi:tRNA modification GTPase
METIFALSSGAPPAGVAVVRISGEQAGRALAGLAGKLPPPRRATLARLTDSAGIALDRALVLWLPGPGTATGEDVAELHLHGGRAVVAAVERALAALGLRRAESGEFTRRAFINGRIDLAEVEGLADLLEAETELQRRAALAMAGGALSRVVEDWRQRLLVLSAQLEAVLDFADEDDAAALPEGFAAGLERLANEIGAWLERPRAEPLREGFRVVLAGPPNTGKSSLFNALLESEAAIVTATPGTTRDVLERAVAIEGVAFTFIDTAGMRDDAGDPVEQIGIARAGAELARADLVLWLGPEGAGPAGAWEVTSKADLDGHAAKVGAKARVSAVSGAGIAELKRDLVDFARAALPAPDVAALNKRQAALLEDAASALLRERADDPLLVAERLRLARAAFDRLTGRASTEAMLDTLFGRFCIGK